MEEITREEFDKLIKYTEYLASHIEHLIQFIDSNPDRKEEYSQFRIDKDIHIDRFNPADLDPQNRMRF